VNREGTLHIVWLNRGLRGDPVFNVGFADYASPGGAMKTIQIGGWAFLNNWLVGMGVTPKVIESTFASLKNDGSAGILHVVLPETTVKRLGLQSSPYNAKEKVDIAIAMLQQQGHVVQPIIRDGTMWFEIDRQMLSSWDEMVNLADGVYTLDVLINLYKVRAAREKEVYSVRFNVFHEPGGPVLTYCLVGAFTPTTFTSTGGVRYPETGALVGALNRLGLPGADIAADKTPTRTFQVSGAQLSSLGLQLPETR